MKPGKLLSVPPASRFASIEEIFNNEDQFDWVLSGSTPFIRLLRDTGFEETHFVITTADHLRGIKSSRLHYGLSFTAINDRIKSDDFKGYTGARDQEVTGTLPGFKTFLLLLNVEGEQIVVVPFGEVLQRGEIRKPGG
jgi:hypothetical protein